MNNQADGLLRNKFRITYSQFVFLVNVEEHVEIDVTRLAEALGVTKSAVSKRLTWFLDRDFVTVHQTPGDSKSVFISLTHKGKELAHASGEFLENEFLNTISRYEGVDYSTLSSELMKIYERLQKRKDAEREKD
ncbi:hypothetical protein AINA4_12990 [Aurantimicrobium sp. INA4]|nr:hypothetical protein AINA4_12990 [Aurantimicrobium sp. INA4]